MTIWGPLVAVVGLWVVVAFGPGMVVARRLGWGPVERVCAAVGVSLLMVYLGALGVYLLGLGRWGYGGTTVLLVAGAAWGWGGWVEVWRSRGARRALVFVGGMLVWGTVCQAVTRHYAGGIWSGDWYIHYEKVAVFLNGGPASEFELRARLLDRPGMMTLIGSYFLGVVGRRFDVFQLVYAWLNVLAVLPCCLLMEMFKRRGGRGIWVVGAMLVALPTLWVNATYTWTKLLAAFYVMLGIALYLRSIRKGDRSRMLGAVVCMAAGVLVHLVAIPYAVLAFGHYVLFVWRGRRGRWGELAAVVGCGAGVLLTWYGWVVAAYGVGELMASNSTVHHHGMRSAGRVAMQMARNFVWTMFPHPVVWSNGPYEQANRWGYLRDYVFLMYQCCLPLVTGTATGLAAGVLAYRGIRLRGRRGLGVGAFMVLGGAGVLGMSYVPGGAEVLFTLFPTWGMMAVAVAAGAWVGGVVGMVVLGRVERAGAEVWFWRGFVVLLPVAGAVAIEVPCDFGYGHIFYHPWAMIGVTLAGVHVAGWRGWARGLVALGVLVDFGLGVWLHLWLESKSFVMRADGTIESQGFHMQTWLNWYDGVSRGFVFVGDRIGVVREGLLVVLAIGGIAAAGVVWAGVRARRGGA